MPNETLRTCVDKIEFNLCIIIILYIYIWVSFDRMRHLIDYAFISQPASYQILIIYLFIYFIYLLLINIR